MAAFFHKGVNFTAEHPDNYDSPAAARLLASLCDYGVNSIALVPYGFTPHSRPEVRFGGPNIMERDEGIVYMARVARENGLRVFLKPQIWVGHGWPGDLDFATPAERTQWFRAYRPFLVHYAQLAAQIKASLFCVGVEFSKLARESAEWRSLAAEARRHFSGPLTYAATQGAEFESIDFWDALDFIGLNNYYPLPDSLDHSAPLAKIETVQRRFKKPVLFPEAGCASIANAHRAPWSENTPPVSLDAQSRYYDSLCRAFFTKPWFAGLYFWKIGTNGAGGPQDTSHTPWRKPVMDILKRWYSPPHPHSVP